MKKLFNILLCLVVLCAFYACKEKVKPRPGEIAEADLKPKADTISGDTIVNLWGEPSPPPAVEGDGSTLFTERLSRPNNVSLDSNEQSAIPDNDYANVTWDDYEEPLASAASSSSRQNVERPRTATASQTKPVAWTPSNDMNFDYSSFTTSNLPSSDIAIVTENGLEVLPYAANDAEKIDFIKNFYDDCFARDGRNVDETMLSVACRRYVQDKVAETGDFGTGRFFRTQRNKASVPWDEVKKNLSIKAVGEDWFKVEMDEGDGKKSLNIKVVEVDGQIKIDMLNNKNI